MSRLLNTIREVLREATPGPWEVSAGISDSNGEPVLSISASDACSCCGVVEWDTEVKNADARLIEEAYELLSEAADEISRLQSHNWELTARVEEMRDGLW